jgi:hypothetical protein
MGTMTNLDLLIKKFATLTEPEVHYRVNKNSPIVSYPVPDESSSPTGTMLLYH